MALAYYRSDTQRLMTSVARRQLEALRHQNQDKGTIPIKSISKYTKELVPFKR